MAKIQNWILRTAIKKRNYKMKNEQKSFDYDQYSHESYEKSEYEDWSDYDDARRHREWESDNRGTY